MAGCSAEVTWEENVGVFQLYFPLSVSNVVISVQLLPPFVEYSSFLSPAYLEAATVERGLKLLNDDQVLVRDEVTFTGTPKKVRWGMMTDASIELMGDQAVLTKNGKKFHLKASSNHDFTFEIEDAKAYHKEAKDNTGKKLLFISLNENAANKYVEISVVLGNNINGLSDVIVDSKLSSW